MVTEATEAARDATFQSRAQEPGGCLSSSWATSRCRGCPGGTNLVCRVLKATEEPTPHSWRTTHLTQECGVPGPLCQLCILASPGEVSCWFLTF